MQHQLTGLGLLRGAVKGTFCRPFFSVNDAKTPSPMTEDRSISFWTRCRNLLQARRLPVWLATVAMLLVLPSMWSGLQFDDYYHRDILLGHQSPPAECLPMTGLFSFLDGDVERTHRLMEEGYLPWWTFEEVRIQFMRPLTELTHVLDYRLWPESPELMHLHSILWFGLMVWLAALVYRDILGVGWMAGLAGLLFALEDAHGVTAGWIAHRNATMAMVFGLLSLLAHHRWRHDGWRPGALIGPACLGIGVLASEGAVATGGYLLAYQLFLDRRDLRGKLLGLVPYVIVGSVWLVSHRMLGFGTWGSGVYLDPTNEPAHFVQVLLLRVPLLLFGQWFNLDPLFYSQLGPSAQLGTYILAILCLGAALVALIPLIRRDAVSRFWIMGMACSLVPISSTFASNRLLLFVGLGAMGLVAQVVGLAVDPAGSSFPVCPRGLRRARVFATVMLILHLGLAPFLLPLSSLQPKIISWWFQEKPLGELLREVDTSGKTLVLLNPASPTGIHHVADHFRRTREWKVPERIVILNITEASHVDVRRVDPYTLDVTAKGGFLGTEMSQLLRGTSHPMPVGQRVTLSRVTAEIRAQGQDGLPSQVRFAFPVPLDDPSLLFAAWNRPGFTLVPPPADGTTLSLRPVAGRREKPE